MTILLGLQSDRSGIAVAIAYAAVHQDAGGRALATEIVQEGSQPTAIPVVFGRDQQRRIGKVSHAVRSMFYSQQLTGVSLERRGDGQKSIAMVHFDSWVPAIEGLGP